MLRLCDLSEIIHCKNLRNFKIIGSPYVNIDPLQHCSNLCKLHLQDYNNNCVRLILKCKLLKLIHLMFCHNLEDINYLND